MTFSKEDPFEGKVPPSVPLPATPLSGVLVQIRFPEVLSIAKVDYIAEFQELIRSRYPLSNQDRNLVLQMGPDGAKQTTYPNWRFMDADGGWRVSLTTNFLALETRAYAGRQDFIDRTAAVSKALQATVDPSFMTRVGIRYVDRLQGELLDDLPRLVRPEVLGLCTGMRLKNISRTWSEVSAATEAGPITARWGFMPPNQTHEPELMPPVAAPCWFLDTDAYLEFPDPRKFDSDKIATHVTELATRSYGFFRWVVNDAFLKACGAQV
ncbi:MAG: TIGR04255 family protein [Gammaproteobacteria bacterium]|nr:TIGR04255 family protein [Gammaproteobacteria bacterium]MDE0367236.1 TIGR04255 family protein [Gammaproteobacteria bacterium]